MSAGNFNRDDLPQPTRLGVWLICLMCSLVIATGLVLLAHYNETVARWW